VKFCLLLLSISISIFSAEAQSKQDLIKTIRQEFQKINSDTGLKKTILEDEEFLDNISDGGAELTGYSRKGSIVKIVEWIGLSYGNRTREFYFKDHKLFFVFEKFDSFIDEKSGELDISKPKKVFEGRYYFNNEKLIEEKLSGKKPLADDKISAAELLSDAKENAKLLSKMK